MNIKILIVDDNPSFLFDLKENLKLICDIEIVGEATNYKKAKSLLLSTKPDLVFLDIEMPVKNGFELLEEMEKDIEKPFKVIFYTAYDKYMIEALRKAAFDYLVKPLAFDDLKNAIQRYRQSISVKTINPKQNLISQINNKVALPVITGVRFVDKNHIVYAMFIKAQLLEKAMWIITLSNNEQIKLRRNTNAYNLLNILGNDVFFQISKAVLVNKNYICLIEYKTRKCILTPPFNNTELSISRIQMAELRKQFDQF